MPRKKRSYTKADVKYAFEAVQMAGKEPAYFKHCTDGGFRVVVRDPSEPAKTEPANDWDNAPDAA